MRSRSLSFILNITVFMFHPLFTADNTDMIIIHLCSRQQQSERRLQQIQTSRLFPDQQTISIPQLSVCPSVRGQTATTHDHSCISTHTHTHTHTHTLCLEHGSIRGVDHDTKTKACPRNLSASLTK